MVLRCPVVGRKFFLKKESPQIVAKYDKTNFETNFGSLPVEMYQQPTPSGQKCLKNFKNVVTSKLHVVES